MNELIIVIGKRIFSLTLTFLIILAVQSIASTEANPVVPKHIDTPIGTKPPTISVYSIENNSAFVLQNIPLNFNATIAESNNTHLINSIYYKLDDRTETYVYSLNVTASVSEQKWITNFSYNEVLKGLSIGNHSLLISVISVGGFFEGGYYYDFYNIGSCLLLFTINTVSTPTATVPEFPITTLLLAVLAAVSLLLVIGKRKLTVNH
jgi:hypothetical protein